MTLGMNNSFNKQHLLQIRGNDYGNRNGTFVLTNVFQVNWNSIL